jgi:hypothetical protein
MKNLVVMTLFLFGMQQASAKSAKANAMDNSNEGAFSHSQNSQESEYIPGCPELNSVRAVARISTTTSDNNANIEALRTAYRALCSPGTAPKGATVYYPNGQRATDFARTAGATWWYPNGSRITDYAGTLGATWWWPNGGRVTDYMGKDGATWWYSNGARMTDYFATKGATWWYPNGQRITDYAGTQGATWWYPNGARLSDYMGKAGATWWYEDGTVWTQNGPEVSEEILSYPHLVIAKFLDNHFASAAERSK